MTKLIMLCFAGFLNLNPDFNITYSKVNKKKIHINYDLSKKLTWQDYAIFYGVRREAALTASEISYNIINTDDAMNVNVTCVFDKSRSNVVSRYRNDYILNHEQKHFDISFIYAMKFIDELKRQQSLTYVIIDEIYSKIFYEWTAYQNKYDEETKNSVSKEMQLVWDQKINQQLKLLDR